MNWFHRKTFLITVFIIVCKSVFRSNADRGTEKGLWIMELYSTTLCWLDCDESLLVGFVLIYFVLLIVRFEKIIFLNS